MEIQRKKTRLVKAGTLLIGGGNPVVMQSMCNTDTRDADATIGQARRLKAAGCQLVRVAVPDAEAADALADIVASSGIPICADIHFDYKLALKAIDAGASKVRINPGNIGSEARVAEVVAAAKDHGVPIRIGVNSGSLSKKAAAVYGKTALALVESALEELSVFERLGFYDTVLSVKSSDALETVEANRILSERVSYPIHLGVTEAGPPDVGIVRSAAALGALLLDGIGDTVRISLTGDPVLEVRAAKELLVSLGLMKGLKIISCPTCGRSRGDVASLVNEVRTALEGSDSNLTIAVMGCEVNGPGEAAGADYGLACGVGAAAIFIRGELVCRAPLNEAAKTLLKLIQNSKAGS